VFYIPAPPAFLGCGQACEIYGNLVIAPGHAEVMRRYGYSIPTHVIGWFFCDVKPWQTAEGLNVLFGPIHPVKAGKWEYPEDIEANKRVFEKLLAVPYINLTVRHIHPLEANGLWEAPRVHYMVYPDNNTDDIDQADIVVEWDPGMPGNRQRQTDGDVSAA
jgi:hypothetical protein